MTRFARFFKNYSIGISVVVAALPLAVLRWNIVPQFASLKPLSTFIASGSSFLLVGIIFSLRHSVARLFFPGLRENASRVAHAGDLSSAKRFAGLPIVLWIVAILAAILYSDIVQGAETEVAFRTARGDSTQHDSPAPSICAGLRRGTSLTWTAVVTSFGGNHRIEITCFMPDSGSLFSPTHDVELLDGSLADSILLNAPLPSVPDQIGMHLLFLITFASAAAAFILTGLRDYLQAELQLSDRELILRPPRPSRKERFDIVGAPGAFGTVEYSPEAPDLPPRASGPYCAWHRLEPEPDDVDPASGKVLTWKHTTQTADNKTKVEKCPLAAQLTVGEMETRFRESWKAAVHHGLSEIP